MCPAFLSKNRTHPTYPPLPPQALASLGYFGVPIYSNGWGGFQGTDYLRDSTCSLSQTYQCVHYIQKYYQVVKNKNIGNANAEDYWFSYSSHNLTQRISNGYGIPQSGDIIVLQNNSTGHYHVAIIASASNYILRIFQENYGQTQNSSTGTYCYPFKDLTYTSNTNGYTVNGSNEGPYTVLGWVR